MASADPAPTRPPRLGPRPLGLHLATAVTTWLSSAAALPHSRNSSPAWNPDQAWHPTLRERGQTLARDLASAEPEALRGRRRPRGPPPARRARARHLALPASPLPPRRHAAAGGLEPRHDTAARLRRLRARAGRRASARRPVAGQPRLHPRPAARAQPDAPPRRGRLPAAAGRLGNARPRRSGASI